MSRQGIDWCIYRNSRGASWQQHSLNAGLLHPIPSVSEKHSLSPTIQKRSQHVHQATVQLWRETTSTKHEQHLIHCQLDYNKREFRLLKIEPPDPKASSKTLLPKCTIKKFSLESAPPYKAVSYRWGESLDSRKILVIGLPTDISDNLFDFFLQGRLEGQVSMSDNGWPDRLDTGIYKSDNGWLSDRYKLATEAEKQWSSERWLWIDQLCINQSSIDEKNHQVAQMGVIFSKAIEVLVWLGTGVDGTEKAVRVARISAQRAEEEDRTMSDLQAFQKIVSNQYWSRLWIIQEFVLVRTVIIMSGSEYVIGAHFRELARDVARSDSSLGIARIWPFMTARRRLTAAYMQRRTAKSFYGPELQYTWQDVMKLAKKAECKDVRDRVYGMLSMVRH
jgi:hypothetical protein